jgi:hypothetical protein
VYYPVGQLNIISVILLSVHPKQPHPNHVNGAFITPINAELTVLTPSHPNVIGTSGDLNRFMLFVAHFEAICRGFQGIAGSLGAGSLAAPGGVSSGSGSYGINTNYSINCSKLLEVLKLSRADHY